MVQRVGRNDPCPCGSGRKFKKCCIGPPGPTAALVEEGTSDRWKIELKNFRKFGGALGRDVLNAFCRCFVHADRLNSMVSFAHVSQQHYGSDSVAFGRDLQTMVWFTIGTLRELALAIRDLRGALARRGILDPDSDPWKRLRVIEDRWEGDEFFRRMRNIAAFHVDKEIIDKGLDELVGERDVVLSHGEGPKMVRSSLPLGQEALSNGLGIDLATYGRFLDKVSDDHGAAGTAIQEAFGLAARRVGIQFGDE